MLAESELAESDSESEEDEDDELSEDESESEKAVAFRESWSLVTELGTDAAASGTVVESVAPESYSSMNFCRSVSGSTERSVGVENV